MKAINTTNFKCKIVTPLNMGGANIRALELRPSSLKGAMRFWWRAIHGNMVLFEMKEKEAFIFGTGGENGGKSTFKLRFGNKELIEKKVIIKIGQRHIPLHCFISGSTFEVVISCTGSEENLKKIEDLLIITLALGGIGKRSRRGMGSIQIIQKNGELFKMPSTLKELGQLLNRINPGMFEIKQDRLRSSFQDPASYPFIKEIQIGKIYKDYNFFLDQVGHAAHNYNSIFTGAAKVIRDKSGNEIKRFASPIFISALVAGDDLFPVITTLNCEFGIDVSSVMPVTNFYLDTSLQFKEAILYG